MSTFLIQFQMTKLSNFLFRNHCALLEEQYGVLSCKIDRDNPALTGEAVEDPDVQ